MKRIFLCILAIGFFALPDCAQNEAGGRGTDEVSEYGTSEVSGYSAGETGRDSVPMLPADVKEYGGFLLDMRLMRPESSAALPKLLPSATNALQTDYSQFFRLNPDAVYTQGLSDRFAPSRSVVYSLNPFGLTGFGFWNPTDNLQMGSFRLKNGMRINTYGEYDKEGWKVRNPSALPWQRNNFKGAFEMKSANGSFGIRIEVQQGNRSPF